MTFNNINVVNSTVGIVAIESTLTNIDARVGNIRQKGDKDIAAALARVSEAVMNSPLGAHDQGEVLEQVDLIAEQAEKAPAERRSAVVKGALAFLEGILANVANLATVWGTAGPTIRGYFGI